MKDYKITNKPSLISGLIESFSKAQNEIPLNAVKEKYVLSRSGREILVNV